MPLSSPLGEEACSVVARVWAPGHKRFARVRNLALPKAPCRTVICSQACGLLSCLSNLPKQA